MTFKSIANDIWARFASLDILIEPEESAVREAVNRHRAREPEYFKDVKKIVVEHNPSTPYVGKATGDGVIHISIDAIKQQLSKLGRADDVAAFSEEVYKTLAHEVAHISGGHGEGLAGEGEAEGEEARMGGAAPTIRSASAKYLPQQGNWAKEPWIEGIIAKRKSLNSTLDKNRDALSLARQAISSGTATPEQKQSAESMVAALQPLMAEVDAINADLGEIQRLREALSANTERYRSLSLREKQLAQSYTPESKTRLTELVKVLIPQKMEKVRDPSVLAEEKVAVQSDLDNLIAEADKLRVDFGDALKVSDALAASASEAEQITARLEQFKSKYALATPESAVVVVPVPSEQTDDFVIDEDDAFVLQQSVDTFKNSIKKLLSSIDGLSSALQDNKSSFIGESAVAKQLKSLTDQVHKGLSGMDRIPLGKARVSRDIFDGFRQQVVSSAFEVLSFIQSEDFEGPLTSNDKEKLVFNEKISPIVKAISSESAGIEAANRQLIGSSDEFSTSVFKATPTKSVTEKSQPIAQVGVTKFEEIKVKILNKFDQLSKYKESISLKEREINSKLDELRKLKAEKIQAEDEKRNAQDLIYRARTGMVKNPESARAEGERALESALDKISDLTAKIQVIENETEISSAGRKTGKFYSFLGDRFVQDLTGGTYSGYDTLNRQFERMRKAKEKLDKHDALEDPKDKKLIEDELVAEFTQPSRDQGERGTVMPEKDERDSALDEIAVGLESTGKKSSVTKALFRDVMHSVIDQGGFAGRQLRNLEKFQKGLESKELGEQSQLVQQELGKVYQGPVEKSTVREQLGDMVGERDVEKLVRQERRQRLADQVQFTNSPEVRATVVALGKLISDLEQSGFNPDVDFSKYKSVDFLGPNLLYKERSYPTAAAGNAKILQEVRAWYLKYSDGLSKLIDAHKKEEAEILAELKQLSARMSSAKEGEKDTIKARVSVLKNRLNQATRDLLAASGRIKRDLSDLVDGIVAGLGRRVGESTTAKPIKSDPSLKEERVRGAAEDLDQVRELLGLEDVQDLLDEKSQGLQEFVSSRSKEETGKSTSLARETFGEKLKRDPHMVTRALRKARISEVTKLQALDEEIAALRELGGKDDLNRVVILEKSREKLKTNIEKLEKATAEARSVMSGATEKTTERQKGESAEPQSPSFTKTVEINTEDLTKRSIALHLEFMNLFNDVVKKKYDSLMSDYSASKASEVKGLVDKLDGIDDRIIEIEKRLAAGGGLDPKVKSKGDQRAAILSSLSVPDPEKKSQIDPKAVEAKSKARELAEIRLGKLDQQLEREEKMRQALRDYRDAVNEARATRFQKDSELPPETPDNRKELAQLRLAHEQEERDTVRALYDNLGKTLAPMLEVIPSMTYDEMEKADIFQEFEGMGPAYIPYKKETPAERQRGSGATQDPLERAKQRVLKKIEPLKYGEFNVDPAYDIFTKQYIARDARAAAKKVEKVFNTAEKARKKRYQAVLETAVLSQKPLADAEAEAKAEAQLVVDDIYKAFMEKQNAEFAEHKASGSKEPFVWVNPRDREKYVAADNDSERALRASVDAALPYLHLDSASRMIGQTTPGQQRNPMDYSHKPQSDSLQVARKLEGTLEYIDDEFLDGKQESLRQRVQNNILKRTQELQQAKYFAGIEPDPEGDITPVKNPLDMKAWKTRVEALEKEIARLESVYEKADDRPWQSAAEALFLKFHGMPGPRKEEQVQKRLREVKPFETRPSPQKPVPLFRKSSDDIWDVLRAACRVAAKDVLDAKDPAIFDMFADDFLNEMLLDDGRFGFASPLSKAAAPGDPPKHSDPLNPRETAITLVRLLHHLMQRSKIQNRPKFLQNVREHLVEINPYMLSRKKSNPSAAIGAAMNIIKNVLQSQPPTVISSIMGQLNRML